MYLNVENSKNRPLSQASNSSGSSQATVVKKAEKICFSSSLCGSSEGCVSDEMPIRQFLVRFSSEPYLANTFGPALVKSSSLCNFYQYYYDQFLNHCLSDERTKNAQSTLQSSIRNIINELLETEQSYVNHLHDIINGYLLPMRKDPQVSRRDCLEIFSNITSLCSFNQSLLEELQRCGSDVALVAAAFTRNHHKFLLYSTYCSNYPRCLEALARCMNRTGARNLLTSLQNSLQHQLPLASFLLKPIQRISKYHLFLQNIINCYSSSSSSSSSSKHVQQSSSSSSSSPSSSKAQKTSSSTPSSSLSSSLQQLKVVTARKPSPLGKLTTTSLPPPPPSSSSSSSLSPHRVTLQLPTALSSSSLPSSSLSSTSSSAQQPVECAREALKSMTQVMKNINQTNTLRKQRGTTHTPKEKHKDKEKDRVEERQKRKEFGKTADVGDLLFKDKLRAEGFGGMLHLFVFSRAVLLSRKRSRNKHMVKVFFEAAEALLLEEIPGLPTCFILISTLNPSVLARLQAETVEQKVNCCHQLKRIVSCDVSKHRHVIQNRLNDVCSLLEDKKEQVIDKSSFISIEGTPDSRRSSRQLETPASIRHSTHNNPHQSTKYTTNHINHYTNYATNHNYLFTLKLSRHRKSGGSLLSSYREARCNDVCTEGCEGVYKRQAPSPPAQQPPPLQSYHSALPQPLPSDSTSDGVVDFFYEDRLMGALDSVSLNADDSDFDDCSDSFDSPRLVQCTQSAF